MANSQSGAMYTSNSQTRAANLTSNNSNDVPASKQFVMNATGNLFVASTLNNGADGNLLPQEAQSAFAEVSVFFAALTKAMAESGKSLYDFDALDNIISSSGLFVKVTESDIDFHSKQAGVTFSSELLQTLLGFSGNLASLAKSLTDMIAGMGEAAITIAASNTSQSKKVGTIIFVCEYLLGAISITPIIVSADAQSVKTIWQAGPCLKGNHVEVKLGLTKSVFLFVPPEFVKRAASLNEAMSDPEFNNLIDSLTASIAPEEPPTAAEKPSKKDS
ncbi:hypothetical protein [Pseudoalteromonas 'SMAR']|uniref:hypothetical protein n=1 Tax=Pseudoalteromonas 'SMAR' TaxID=3416908 RepID=UPI003AF1F065